MSYDVDTSDLSLSALISQPLGENLLRLRQALEQNDDKELRDALVGAAAALSLGGRISGDAEVKRAASLSLQWLSELVAQAGQWEDAGHLLRASLRQLAELDDLSAVELAEVFLLLGRVYLEKEQPQAAIDIFAKGAAMLAAAGQSRHALCGVLLMWLGRALLAQKEYALALQSLQSGLDIGGESYPELAAQALWMEADCYGALKQGAQEIETLEKLIRFAQHRLPLEIATAHAKRRLRKLTAR